METMYAEIADLLDKIEQKCKSIVYDTSNTSELHNHILELKDQIQKERDDYRVSRLVCSSCFLHSSLVNAFKKYVVVYVFFSAMEHFRVRKLC